MGDLRCAALLLALFLTLSLATYSSESSEDDD